ncbi:hypothetical protein LTR56_014324 [Elasticomyces elasticus]|nr:hypothetical protein LTR56_014324 [Elasticomyces elasticus]KAK3636388.1 hypothetical protein LTR22_018764 [Elasticomyces elasticus]KAK4916580.1 hypothetical protein LTR49_015413 [Elasticomyces elasticus]KAK5756183.1 hypothetical protein LTS12_013736 [Elasticomyces elasticus]
MPVSFCAFEGCAHYICTNIAGADVVNDFEHLRSTSRAFLKTSAIDFYATPIPGTCPRCSNSPTDLLQDRANISNATKDLQEWLQDVMSRYEHFGREYHRINFSARAKSADLPSAQIAHKQFQISSEPFGSDPFFKPAIQSQLELENVDKKLAADQETLSKSTLLECVNELHSACYNYSAFIRSMQALHASWKIVKKMAENVPETSKPHKRSKRTTVKEKHCKSRFTPTDKTEYIKRIARTIEKKRWKKRVEDSCERVL